MIEFQTIEDQFAPEKIPMMYHDIKSFRAAFKVADAHDNLEPWFMGSEAQYKSLLFDLDPEELNKFFVWFIGDVDKQWIMPAKEFNETIKKVEDGKDI